MHQDGFETDSGWQFDGEWERDTPRGLGTPDGDPASAFSGIGVIGNDLSGIGTYQGDYEPVTVESAISPVFMRAFADICSASISIAGSPAERATRSAWSSASKASAARRPPRMALPAFSHARAACSRRPRR